MGRFFTIYALLLSFCLVLQCTQAGDVDFDGIAGSDEPEGEGSGTEPDDPDPIDEGEITAWKEEIKNREKASTPPDVNVGDDDAGASQGGELPEQIQALIDDTLSHSEEISPEVKPPEDNTPDRVAAGKSASFTKKYWYYPPSPVRCAGQLFDPIRYFCCDGKLTAKTFYYRYQKYDAVRYVDACCCGVPYNTQTQICCKNKIYEITKVGRPGYIGCCNDQAYDKDKQLCCDGKLFNNDEGCTLKCCGCDVYRKKDALCCNDIVVPRRGDNKKMQCCGNSGYYRSTELCCNGCAIKRVGRELCCGDGTYDPSREICCGGKKFAKSRYDSCCYSPPDGALSRPYKASTQICCGGRVYNRIYGMNTRCCSCYMSGKYSARIFDVRRQRCCGCRVFTMPSSSHTHCCCKYMYYYFNRYCPYFPYYYYFPKPYYYHYNYPTCRLMDPNEHSCCNGNIFDKFNSQYKRCCNSASYDSRTKICCNGQIRDRWNNGEPQHMTCCGTEAYDRRYHTCCYNQVLKVFDGKRACCGYELYNPTGGQSCCNGLVVRGGSGYICCGDKAWNGRSYGCCEGAPFYKLRWNCCNSKVVRGGQSHQCCGSKTFNPRTHQCCCNCIHPLVKNALNRCCGTRSYDANREVCCSDTDTVYRKPYTCPT
ncbi:unnamed protein product [Owenia fusiformis]|uniref:Galaxin-like repeats domain-containing protein n=1 Tax=Owenia fusiformis TaxID=6347 RepID=A0A8J1UK80_OWEFU|nr:unnamed protein product [Owenia fusiformis]